MGILDNTCILRVIVYASSVHLDIYRPPRRLSWRSLAVQERF